MNLYQPFSKSDTHASQFNILGKSYTQDYEVTLDIFIFFIWKNISLNCL